MRLQTLCLSMMLAACGGGDDDAGGGGSDGEAQVVLMETVGPEGGTLEGDGIRLDIAPDALAAEVEITVSATDTTVSGFTMMSPVFHLAPAGTTTDLPIVVAIEASAADGDLFYTAPGGSTFEATSAEQADGWVLASVSHLGRGFVGKAGETGGDACEPACSGGDICVGGVCMEY